MKNKENNGNKNSYNKKMYNHDNNKSKTRKINDDKNNM